MSFPNAVTSVQPTNNDEQLSPLWSKVRGMVLKTIVGSVVFAGLIAAVAALFGSFGELHVKALATIVLVVVLAFLAWFDAEVSTNKGNNFALAGLFTSIFLLLAGLYKIWLQDYLTTNEEPYVILVAVKFFQLFWVLVLLRLALLIGSWLVNVSRRYETSSIKATAIGTLVLISLTTLFLVLPLVISHITYGEFYWRAMWATVILTAVGAALIPLCVSLFGPKKPAVAPVNNFARPFDNNNGQTLVDNRGNIVVPYAYDKYGQPVDNHGKVIFATPVQTVNLPAYGSNAQQVSPVQQREPIAAPQPVNAPVAPQPEESRQPVADSATEAQNAPQSVPEVSELALPVQEPEAVPTPPEQPKRRLAWPTYEDGTPLPKNADGTPDYSGV
jgi:hypothetical protein